MYSSLSKYFGDDEKVESHCHVSGVRKWDLPLGGVGIRVTVARTPWLAVAL